MSYNCFTPPPEWMFLGNCLNTKVNMWPKDGKSVAPAKAVCNPPGKQPCPVLAQCLEHALNNHEIHGVLGGTSQNERNRIWRGGSTGRHGPIPKPGCRSDHGNLLITYPTLDAVPIRSDTTPYECHLCGMWHATTKRRAA